jgi:YesN/AraC family two-component response regulator
MRVLLIDDESEFRRSLARVLVRLGVEQVADACDGEEALRLLPDLRPELIITDCQMPGMDGVRLTKLLRATGITMPIIMISGATERTIIDAAMRAGVTRFLAKPLEIADLRDALQETMGWVPKAA